MFTRPTPRLCLSRASAWPLAIAAFALFAVIAPPEATAQSLAPGETPEAALSAPSRAQLRSAIEKADGDVRAADGLAEAAFRAMTDETKLNASDPGADDTFGLALSVDGDRALFGVFSDDDDGTDSGSAYVFDLVSGTWSETQKLKASDAGANDRFGVRVSLDGDRALIGAARDDDRATDAGAAYIFDLSGGTWSETQKITASDGATENYFGRGVSLDGDRVLIGAPEADGTGANAGAAYVFDLSGGTWTQTQKLTASDDDADDLFGARLSLDGDRALIGARQDDAGGTGAGAAYIFDLSGGTWSQTQKLTSLDAGAGDRFGRLVALDGDRALVGAHKNDDDGTDSGSAYVFDLSGGTWSQTQKLTANDAAGGDFFGYSVALSGDRALVGAPVDSDDGTASGSAYLFARSSSGTWIQIQKLTASDAAAVDNFGAMVDLDDDRALVGAPNNDDAASNSGSAYVFSGVHSLVSATSSSKPGWRLLSAPVDEVTVQDLTPLNLVGGVQNDPACNSAAEGDPLTLYTHYDGSQSSGGNDGYSTPATYADALAPGAGFWWYFFDGASTAGPCGNDGDGTKSAVSALPITLAVSGSALDSDYTVVVDGRASGDDEFYLGGNAFDEDIDIGEDVLAFVTATDNSATSVPLQACVQVYDPTAGGGAGGYVLITPAMDGAVAGGGDDLAVWQGAWLERTDGASPAYPMALVYDVDQRVGTQNPSIFYGRSGNAPVADTRATVRFELMGSTADGGVFDGAAAVIFADDASAEWDLRDASKLAPVASPFAMLAPMGENREGAETQKAAESQSLSALAAGTSVPVAFFASAAGDFELTWPQRSGFEEGTTLELEDTVTGERVDLLTETSYAFTSAASTVWENRFVLYASAAGAVGTEETGAASRFVVSSVRPNPTRGAASLVVELPSADRVEAFVYDVLGRRVLAVSERAQASGRLELSLATANLPAGSYVVRVVAGREVETRRFTVVR